MARILLVEPDAPVAHAIFIALRRRDLEVQVCASAQSAISSADTLTPDAVILELQLALHNGLEFLYEFRSYADWQRIPIVAYTMVSPAEFSSNWQLLTETLGVRAYLYKPRASLPKLVHAVERALSANSIA